MLNRKGFTILELLIVIAVIAILVGIALPRFKGMKDEGNYAKAKGELRTLQTAVESYYIHNASAYPAALTNLTGATPNIVNTLPSDAFKSGSNYGYFTTSPYYVIFSVGPDGAAGITGINSSGVIQGTAGDDIYVSNGTSSSGG